MLAAGDSHGPQSGRNFRLAPASTASGCAGIAEQSATTTGHPVIAAPGEERLRLPEPGRRMPPAIPNRSLGRQTEAVLGHPGFRYDANCRVDQRRCLVTAAAAT